MKRNKIVQICILIYNLVNETRHNPISAGFKCELFHPFIKENESVLYPNGISISFSGPVLKFGDKNENGSGNDCTVLLPRNQLYQAFSSSSPISLNSNSGNLFENICMANF